MICEICGGETPATIGVLLGSQGFNACGRCGAIVRWADAECERSPFTPEMTVALDRQVERISIDLASFENLRCMTRAEFRALLRERLQKFGDKCLAVWEEKCGGRLDDQG